MRGCVVEVRRKDIAQAGRTPRFVAGAGHSTPKQIIDRPNAATIQALADPAMQSRLADLGLAIFLREQQTPKALGALQKA